MSVTEKSMNRKSRKKFYEYVATNGIYTQFCFHKRPRMTKTYSYSPKKTPSETYNTNGMTAFLSFGYATPNLSLYHKWPLYALGNMRAISANTKTQGGGSIGANA